MKRFMTLLLPALMLFAVGCKDKNEPEDLPQTLSVNPELITCPDAGGDYTVTVTSPNGSWSATTNESWIRVTPTAGEKGTTEVRIKISPNKESAESKGVITFTSGEETVEFPITRAAKAAPYLRVVSEKALNTPKEGGSYTVQVESNIKWSISSNTGWAKVNKGVTVNNDNITVTVSPATTPEETTATITIAPYGEGEAAGTQQVTITRGSTEATSLSVDPTEITAPENGGSFTVNVSSNAKWRVWKTWDMDWLTLSGSQDGDGNGSFSFSIEEATSMDAVSGILTIEEDRSDNYKPVVTQVAVSRKGKPSAELSVSQTAINAPYTDVTYSVTIKSKAAWEATLEGANFFSVSITHNPYADAVVIMNIKVSKNVTRNERTGKIIIKASTTDEQAVINIHQNQYPYYVPDDPYFLISDNRPIYFSPGNLQYQASTGTRRFAEHQWEYIGENNIYKSISYNGWIDLFGWGTGKDPSIHTQDYTDYLFFEDWYDPARSPISNWDDKNTYWFTLSATEWISVLNYSENGLATVNNVHGLVLLPVNWSGVNGLSLTPTVSDYTTNVYTLNEWTKMEKKGAVFLPAAGYLTFFDGQLNYCSGDVTGNYWSRTSMNGAAEALYLYIDDRHNHITTYYGYKYLGCSVRLVRDAN